MTEDGSSIDTDTDNDSLNPSGVSHPTGTRRIALRLGPTMAKLDREQDILGYVATALLGLPEFQQAARQLLSKYPGDELKALFDLYASYQHWGDDVRQYPDEIAEDEGISLELAQELGDFQKRLVQTRDDWGMAEWEDGLEITRAALYSAWLGFPTVNCNNKVGWFPFSRVHFELEVSYSDQSLKDLEREVVKAVRRETRRQYRTQAILGKQPGSPPDRETVIRNAQWYFLHLRGLSYGQVMIAWNRLNPQKEPLDTTSESDKSKVKQGIQSMRQRFRG